jgi:hypothetical protein
MAHNFRLPGTFFCSKAGHDSNAGTSANVPVKSFAALMAKVQSTAGSIGIIGCGAYNEIYSSTISIPSRTIRGDGKVILIGDSVNNLIFGNAANAFFTVIGLVIENYNEVGCISVNAESQMSFVDCIIKSNLGIGTGTSYQLRYRSERSVFINSTIKTYPTIYNGLVARDSIFINCSGVLREAYNSYINTASAMLLTTPNIININPALFRNNNVQGTLRIGNAWYAIQDQFTDTPQDNGYDEGVKWLTEANLTADGYTGTITGWNTAVATCINRDPKFNNAQKLDFTLRIDSPHIKRAQNGIDNIGDTKYGQSYYVGEQNPNLVHIDYDSNEISNSNPNDLVLVNQVEQGLIRMILKAAGQPEEIDVINYIGNLAFDADAPGGTTSETYNGVQGTQKNFNVPDSKPVTSEYPTRKTTTSGAANATTVNCTAHGATVGQFVRVAGEVREITGVTNDVITVGVAFRGNVGSGVTFSYGTESQFAFLNPNRLNCLVRSSKLLDVNASNWDLPQTWDNDGLATAGQYLVQEWGSQPKIDNVNGVGFGDDHYVSGVSFQAVYLDILIYLRDNYRS